MLNSNGDRLIWCAIGLDRLSQAFVSNSACSLPLRFYPRFIELEEIMNPVTKFLVFLTILIGSILAVLWYSGGKPQEFQTMTTIDARPDIVFKCLLDPQLRLQWIANLRETALVQDPQPELLSVYESIYDRNGQSVNAEERIQNWVKDQYLVIRRRDDQWEWMSIFRLEAAGKQTHLEYAARQSPTGLNRLGFMFYQSTGQQQIEQELTAVKKLAESTPHDPSGSTQSPSTPTPPDESAPNR